MSTVLSKPAVPQLVVLPSLSPVIPQNLVLRADQLPPRLPLAPRELSPQEIEMIASKGWAVFRVDDRDWSSMGLDSNTGDIVVPVEGVPDYDRLISRMQSNPLIRVKLDIADAHEGQATGASFIPVDLDTVLALKEAYIAAYGNTEHPDYYTPNEGYTLGPWFPPNLLDT
jgi:hypothetical protein